MAASEASAALDSAYQGLEEAAQNQIPAEMVPDFAQIRLGFAVLKQQLGMELSVDNKFDLALGEFQAWGAGRPARCRLAATPRRGPGGIRRARVRADG
ncbi:hypothetical protein [Nonomuraea dietziae]|uniref:hypothetical protein n=1 Tax=Nonomuraea dietziae TaxID=65515 RepID=UPI0031D5B76C